MIQDYSANLYGAALGSQMEVVCTYVCARACVYMRVLIRVLGGDEDAVCVWGSDKYTHPTKPTKPRTRRHKDSKPQEHATEPG